MSLELYRRGEVYWAKGWVKYNGRRIGSYVRASTGSTKRAGGEDWVKEKTQQEIRRHLLGEEASLTFAQACGYYDPTPETAKYLIPIVEHLGDEYVHKITAAQIRALGPILYPNNATDSWRRWVITPARAVINNAHDKLNACQPIRVKGYSAEERRTQDEKRGKASRVEKKVGSMEWLLMFREHAEARVGTLALFMYATGARIGQSTRMDPDQHLDLQNHSVCIPGAKGHGDRWIQIPVELVVELANLTPRVPRGWPRKKGYFRVFGYAGKDGPRKAWAAACKKAGIDYIPPHAAGRHGFGQEMNVRQGVDKQATMEYGGWADGRLLDETYSHSEDSDAKIISAFRTSLVQAEKTTGLKLNKNKGL